MPRFDVLCPEHGVQEVFGRDPDHLGCPLCSSSVKRVWSRPASFRIDFTEGWDPGAGKNFATKQERDNWVAESGSRRIKD